MRKYKIAGGKIERNIGQHGKQKTPLTGVLRS